jgi:hypothetical protein
MRRGGAHARQSAAVALLAAVCSLAVALPVSASEPSTSSRQDARAVVERALQVSDDAVYLPVQSQGRWTLASPGSWLQPSISTSSSPWRWTTKGRCTVFDPALVPGMTAFMHEQIAGTFGGAEAAQIRSTFDTKVRRLAPAPCLRSTGLALGPPGPLRDRTSVRYIAFSGSSATAAAVVHMTDWQGGVTNKPTAGGGRRINWAVVSNAVDVTYKLTRGRDGGWRVVAFTGRFAPGSEP